MEDWQYEQLAKAWLEGIQGSYNPAYGLAMHLKELVEKVVEQCHPTYREARNEVEQALAQLDISDL